MAAAIRSPKERAQQAISDFRAKPAGQRLWVVVKNREVVKVVVKAQSCFDSFLIHLSNFIDRLVRSKNFQRSAYLIASIDDARLKSIEAILVQPRPSSATDNSPERSHSDGSSGAGPSGEDHRLTPPSPRAASSASAGDASRKTQNEEINKQEFAQQQQALQHDGKLSDEDKELLERVAKIVDWSTDPAAFESALRAATKKAKKDIKTEKRQWAQDLCSVQDQLITVGSNWELVGARGSRPSGDYITMNQQFDALGQQFPTADQLFKQYAQFKDRIDSGIRDVLEQCLHTMRAVGIAQSQVKILVGQETEANRPNPMYQTKQADAIREAMETFKRARKAHLTNCQLLLSTLTGILTPPEAAAAAADSPALLTYSFRPNHFAEPTDADKASLA